MHDAWFHVKSSTQHATVNPIDSLSSRKYKLTMTYQEHYLLSFIFTFFGRKKKRDIHTSNGIYNPLFVSGKKGEAWGQDNSASPDSVPIWQGMQLTNQPHQYTIVVQYKPGKAECMFREKNACMQLNSRRALCSYLVSQICAACPVWQMVNFNGSANVVYPCIYAHACSPVGLFAFCQLQLLFHFRPSCVDQ